jgi:hypothetical protein
MSQQLPPAFSGDLPTVSDDLPKEGTPHAVALPAAAPWWADELADQAALVLSGLVRDGGEDRLIRARQDAGGRLVR